MFQNVDAYAGDPILSLMEKFKQDPRAHKVNLSIGLYYDAQGIIPQMRAVAAAQAQLNSVEHGASVYLPMEGLQPYRSAIQHLLFGAQHPMLQQGRIATIQTVGGSGALKVGADFLKSYFPNSQVWVSDPTGKPCRHLQRRRFQGEYLPVFRQRKPGREVRRHARCAETAAEAQHRAAAPCCHNPTGSDLTPAQWDEVVKVIAEREIIPFLDIAYQGFGGGMEQDAYAIRAIAAAGLPCPVSNSFSKIFSLYGERVGGLSVVRKRRGGRARAGSAEGHRAPQLLEPAEFRRAAGQGAERRPVENPMAGRGGEHAYPHSRDASRAGGHPEERAAAAQLRLLLAQRGMFSYTGFSAAQVDRLREEFGVYLIHSGRMRGRPEPQQRASGGRGICCGAVTPVSLNGRSSGSDSDIAPFIAGAPPKLPQTGERIY